MSKHNSVAEVFHLCAEEYEAKFMNTDLYHDSFDQFCIGLKDGAAILEIASGPGNITQYLLLKRPDLNILGIDIAPKMIELAQKNNPTAAFRLMDCREIKQLKEKYDGIMSGFCLPYLSKEEALQFIQDASERLHPGGHLYISTMEDDYVKSGLHSSSSGEYQLYLHYHENAYLNAALEDNGFQVIDVERKVYQSLNGSQTTDMILIAKKH